MRYPANFNEHRREEAMARSRAQSERDLTTFVEAMGINHEFLELVDTISYETPRALTRQEIYRFRIDTRDFAETAWTLEKVPRPGIRKFAVVKSGDGFRKLEWQLYCDGRDRARLMLIDELDKAVTGTRTVSIIAGLEKQPNLVKFPVRLGSSEIWNVVIASDELKNLSTAPGFKFRESTPMPDGKAAETTFEIETASLEDAWTQLSATCAAQPNITGMAGITGLPNAAPRAQAAGLASVARPIQTSAIILNPRAAAAAKQIDNFILWARSKGLQITARTPIVKASAAAAPSAGTDSITLGPVQSDYLVPGLYVNIVATSQGFDTDPKNGTHELKWTTADYLASRFGEVAFGNPAGPHDSPPGRSAEVARLFNATYDLFNELVSRFGNDKVDVGVINMMNEWNSRSDLQSSLASFAAGMTLAGANEKSLKAAFEKFKSSVAQNSDAQVR